MPTDSTNQYCLSGKSLCLDGAGILTTSWEREHDCLLHPLCTLPASLFSSTDLRRSPWRRNHHCSMKLLFSPLFVCLEAQPRNFPVSLLRPALVLSLSAKGQQACSSNGRPFCRPGPQVWRRTRTPGVADHMEHRTARNTRAHRHAAEAKHMLVGSPREATKEEACGNLGRVAESS